MNRFWIFPLTFALISLWFLQLTFLEVLFPIVMFYGSFIPARPTLSALDEVSTNATPYCMAIGIALGIALALFDWSRNGYNRHTSTEITSTLLANLWWCGIYITVVNALNTLLALAIIQAAPLSRTPLGLGSQAFFPLLFAAVLNVSAVLWASIRSITSQDVLSPQVLGAMLRRSVHIRN